MQRIEFIEYKERHVKFRREDVFAINPKKKALWLQKVCVWVLKKLECQWWDEKTEFTRHAIDANSFAENLYKQKAALFSYFNEDSQTLLIGSEDYSQLMACPEIHQSFQFRTEFKRGFKDGSGGFQVVVYGLNVKVVPWMRGMVVMP